MPQRASLREEYYHLFQDQQALSDLSIVIPVYNEQESLAPLFDKLVGVMEGLDLDWEVIFVDDGSTDGSLAVLQELQRQNERVIIAVQRRNTGKSLALNTGFALAQGKILVTMDADLQDEPSEIPRLLAKIDEGHDLVVGWKKHRQDPLSKRIPSWVANSVTRLATGVKLHDMNSGLKAFRAECVRDIRLYGDLHRYIPAIVHYNGFRVAEIPVVHHKRRFGRSKYGPGRLLCGGLDLMTVLFLHNFRYRPLHLFGGSGMVFVLTGFFINLYLSIEWFNGVRPLNERPLLTLGVLLMVIGGQLVTIGLLAELVVDFIQRGEDPLRMTTRVYHARPASPDSEQNDQDVRQ